MTQLSDEQLALVEEVERLRATFNTQGQTVLRQCDEIEALRAENERLTLELTASLACNAANNKLFMQRVEFLLEERVLIDKMHRAENERLTARAEKAEAYMDKFAAESNRLREALEGE